MAVKTEKQSSPVSSKWDSDPATVRTLTTGDAGSTLAKAIAEINAIQGIGANLREELLQNAKTAAAQTAGGLTVSLIRGTIDAKGKRLPDLVKMDGVYRGVNRSTVESIIRYAEQLSEWLADCDKLDD